MQTCTKMHDFLSKISQFPGGHTVLSDTCGGRDIYKGKHPQAPIPQTQVAPARPPMLNTNRRPSISIAISISMLILIIVLICELSIESTAPMAHTETGSNKFTP